MRNAIVNAVAILAVLLSTLAFAGEAKAHHRAGPCDAHFASYSGGVKDGIRCVFNYVGVSSSKALDVAWCESRFNRWANNDGNYLGLFQHAARYWDDRVRTYGTKFGYWVFGIRANSYIAARMVRSSGWGAWSCA